MVEEKFIEVSGINTRYRKAGQGEPLVLVHGGNMGRIGCASDWLPVFDGLSRSFSVYALDKIGQGFTDNPKSGSEYVIGTTVWHVYEFMKSMGIEKAHVAGHSRGGYAVCRLALEHPEAVKSVTIVDSGTLMHTSTSWYDKMEARAAQITDQRESIKYQLAANSFSNRHISEEWLDEVVSIQQKPKFKKAIEWVAGIKDSFIADLTVRQKETHEWMKAGRLKSPTLIIWGFNDPSTPVNTIGLHAMNLIFPNVPTTQMHVLNQAGHFCFREQPHAFVAAVHGFIKSL